ncbi:DUF6221 family protein [Streptomyces sp. NBC_00140]|uniref:DUF6221 family protein n=1 Tax=Streptomyces sp. NBC_00140 TaxID=2975664 RepID=UPI00225835ED|nr:DUF6221 family protein [Streptomyces sp. NBC_00140]MCX5335494.1 DUF6221 family protein [Streptomyces sp. NBC_00140]MCX5338326.1 DUF6221 family protein [Streptomyces sp. NBC_00140]
MELVDFLRARLDEDALWATEASRRKGEQASPGGVHWHWVTNDSDQEVTPDPGREANVGEDAEEAVSLRSRETWPTASGVGDLPQFALYADEVPSAVGGHIVRHDPARVLAEVEAKRQLTARGGPFCTSNCDEPGNEPMDPDTNWTTPLEHHFGCGAHEAAKLFARPFRDHPDFDPAWLEG